MAADWLPPGAKLNDDGSVTMPNGAQVAGPGAGYTRDPNTGIISPTGNPTAKALTGPGAVATTPAATSDWSTDTQYAGMDPRLKALYQKHDITPQGQGTGFTDWQYWNNKLKEDPTYDFLGRLDKDLSGTGTDRSTGTIWGDKGAPAGVDSLADNSGYSNSGAQMAGLVGGNPNTPGLDVTSQGTGPGSYAWRQAQIYALQQRLINGGNH